MVNLNELQKYIMINYNVTHSMVHLLIRKYQHTIKNDETMEAIALRITNDEHIQERTKEEKDKIMEIQ